jgi:hypothetical protein
MGWLWSKCDPVHFEIHPEYNVLNVLVVQEVWKIQIFINENDCEKYGGFWLGTRMLKSLISNPVAASRAREPDVVPKQKTARSLRQKPSPSAFLSCKQRAGQNLVFTLETESLF